MPSPIPAELPCASAADEAARCASHRHSPVHRSEWRVVSAALSGSAAERMGPRETALADCALGRRGMAAGQDWAGRQGTASDMALLPGYARGETAVILAAM